MPQAQKREKPDARKPPEMTEAQKAYLEQRKHIKRASEAHSAMPHGQKDSPAMREAFLSWLRLGATPSRAAKECGLGRTTVFQWKDKDPNFRAAWEEAMQTGTDRIEDEATRRAVDGYDRPVFQQGECVGFVREYSDDLMKFILMARDPARFSKNGQTGVPAGAEINFTFNFGGSNQIKGKVHAPLDGSLPVESGVQRRPLLDHRSDDQGGQDRRLLGVAGRTGDDGE